MQGSSARKLVPPVLLAATLIAAPFAASAAPPGPPPKDVDISLPAGEACVFPLHVVGTDSKAQVITHKNGRVITAGKGFTLTFTNEATGKTVTIRSSGSVQKTTTNPDGTSTVEITGGNVLILFPSDVPAGPSTKQYVGRVVYTVDANGVFTVQSTSGTQRDVCAELVG